jgi:tripartite-type tricarboxylate transporter receptor subunit TctC
MKSLGRTIGTFLMVVLCAMFLIRDVTAQEDFPNKPIQLIVPYAPGGSADLSARLAAEKMGALLRQPVVVVNKPGAGTAIGVSFVATSKPDGYTLLAGTGGVGVQILMNPGVTYKTSDFIPVARLLSYTQIAVAEKDLPVKTLAELVPYIQKHAKTLSYSSPGVGSSAHLVFEWLNMKYPDQLDIQHIPYTGFNPALTAILGKHAHASVLPVNSIVLKHIKANEIRALAVFSPKRLPFLPDVPTAIEQGFPLEIMNSFIYYAPVKTPSAIVKKLEGTIETVLLDKALQEKLEKMDLMVDFQRSADAQKAVDYEVNLWGPVIKKANIISK